jgi:hypothetical protein
MRLQGRKRRCPRSALPAVRPLQRAHTSCHAHCAMPTTAARGAWNSVQHSRWAARTATAAPETILGSRPRRRARAWRPSPAQICTPAARITRTSPLDASGTRSAASSTGTRTRAARTTRSRSRYAPVRRTPVPPCVPPECEGTWLCVHASSHGTRVLCNQAVLGYSVLGQYSGYSVRRRYASQQSGRKDHENPLSAGPAASLPTFSSSGTAAPWRGCAAGFAASLTSAYVFAFECACTDLLEDPGVSMHMHSHSCKALI